jgi:hypothetical protein
MNRRKAIYSIIFFGGGVFATFSGYKYYNNFKTPDLGFLDTSKSLIADLSEIIIPTSDTPGAKDALVSEKFNCFNKRK